jgi:hypothetical protein
MNGIFCRCIWYGLQELVRVGLFRYGLNALVHFVRFFGTLLCRVRLFGMKLCIDEGDFNTKKVLQEKAAETTSQTE